MQIDVTPKIQIIKLNKYNKTDENRNAKALYKT